MAEEKLIETTTQVNINNNKININIFYQKKEDLQFFISDSYKALEGVTFNQGDLGSIGEGDLFNIDNQGNLNVITSNPDRYSLNSNGELIVTE